MPISTRAHITRDMLRAEQDTLFVFGDNLLRKGLGGQAKEMRGEPNAVGIPTKREPSMKPAAFFTDRDHGVFIATAVREFSRLAEHLQAGGAVVLPDAGLGTGLADLERRSPQIWTSLQEEIARLKALATSAPSLSAGENGR